MPANRRPSTSPLHLGMDPVTTPMDAAFNTQQHSPSSSTHLDSCRSRTQSMLPMVRDEVFLLHNTSQNTINIPVPASLHTKMSSSFSNDYVPSYISSRSANSLISFSRPTRIQAKTLHYLNKILDELLEQILSSAKSLATDRIKSDGILKVLGGQSGSGSGAGALLAKNAVLEAELELRNYLEGQRKEGGKMPLGLSATSRWDGTDTFPVQRAYEALRIRCQYYSTLGDLEDPSPHSPADQNIMSADGRPVATITPGVAIYVTALLEFIAEYILQNVGRVIERDNSDEAELGDLSKALEEDEGSTYWWKRLAVRGELLGIETAEQDRAGRGKVKKPWKVPDADEWDEAAGRRGVERHSVSMGKTRSSGVASINDSRVQGSLSLSGHESRDSTSYRATSPLPPLASSQLAEAMTASGSAESPVLSRRTSSDKGWFSKRRGSFRASSDFLPSNVVISAPPKGALTTADVNSSAFEDTPGSDDFDSLMMSGQTMKVSLTPNRLRSIEVAGEKEYFDDQEDGEGKRSSRRRPGTLSPLPYRENEPTTPKSALPSPSLKGPSRMSLPQQASEPVDDGSTRSVSRQGSIGGYRSPKYVTKKAAPPSSYRSVDAARSPSTDIGNTQLEEEDSLAIDGALPAAKRRQKDLSAVTGSDISPKDTRLLPRDETTQRSTNVRDMVDMFNSTPPLTSYNGAFPVTAGSSGRESRQSQSQASSFSNDTLGGNTTSQRKSALSSAGGKVRNLFGRKSSSTNSSLSLAGGFSGRESQEVEAKKSSSVRKLDVDSAHFRSQSDLPMSRSGSAYEVADPPQPSPRRVNGIATNSDSPLTSSFSPNAAAAAAAAAVTKPLPVVRTDEMEDTTRRMERDSRLSQEIDPLDVTSGTRQSKDSSLQHHLESSTESSGQRNASGENQSNGNGWKHRASVASSHDPATVGMYQEQRGNYSASDLSSSHNHGTKGELPSRKVPWSYSRQSSNASRRLSGTLPVNRVGSVGSGSAGHASAIDSNAPPSAWSHIQPPLRDEHSEANGAENGRKTPTPSAPSTFAGTSPRSPLLGNKPSDTARVLAQLSQKMRGASSVDECRSLVMQALAAAAVAVRSEVEQSANSAGMMRSSSALSWQTPHIRARSGSASMEIGGHEASLADKKEQYRRSSATLSLAPTRKDIDERGMAQGLHSQTVDVLPSLIVPRQKSKYDAVREQLSPPPKHRHLLFPMAVGYEQSDDSSAPSHKQQGQFAAWLLDGEPFDLVSALVPDKTTGHDKGSELSAATAPHAPVLLSTPAASKDEYGASSRGQSPDTYASADERLQDSPPQDPSILAARRASNVESVRSTYRDASETIHK